MFFSAKYLFAYAQYGQVAVVKTVTLFCSVMRKPPLFVDAEFVPRFGVPLTARRSDIPEQAWYEPDVTPGKGSS